MIRVFNHYISITVLVVLLGDIILTLLSISLVSILVHPGSAGEISSKLIFGVIWVLSLAFLFFQAGLYDTLTFDNAKQNIVRIVGSFLILSVIGWAAIVLIPQFHLEIQEAFLILILTFLGIVVWRFLFVSRLPLFGWKQRTLILGTFQISKILEELNRFRHNIRIQGVVDPQKLKDFDLVKYALENRIHSIVISLKDRRGTLPIQNILACKMHGINVMEWATFCEKNMNMIDIMNINPSHLVLGDGFQRNRMTIVIKGIIDRFLALCGLIAFMPFGIFISLMIKLESKGPIFYSQERIGQNGRSFQILKFRSMIADAEKGLPPQWASERDPRITRVGSFLRKTRLDEVPQLINILFGEMSFVGPRPERPFFVNELEKKIPFYSLRHVVKPGLSGWAQIRYRYGATLEDAIKKLEYDFYYIKNMSIFMDLMILLETIQVILFGKGSR